MRMHRVFLFFFVQVCMRGGNLVSIGNSVVFHLPEGWTLRKVANTLVQEWLTPFRAAPALKVARWVVQSVMNPDKSAPPIWEPGIPTEEYEARLDSPDLAWVIRATAGRGKSTVLANLAMRTDHPGTFEIVTATPTFPETLFDTEKVDQFLSEQGGLQSEAFFAAILANQGFDEAKQPV